VVVTARGPVITPLLEGLGMALSLRATWLQPAPVRGLLDVVRATDFASFRAPFVAWPGPALNVVYADRDGGIGWQLIGTLPRRSDGNGTLPRPAWEPGWEDEPVSFAEMPSAFDPADGYLVSANNAPRADAPDQPFLGVDWLDGYRAAAIDERLAVRSDWDLAATAALQTDVTSIPWREMRDAVLAVVPGSPAETLALALLRGWDGRVEAGSAAASVFELFVADLAASTTRAAAPRAWRWAMGAGFGDAIGRTSFGARAVGRLSRSVRAGGVSNEAIRSALRQAVGMLTAARGPDPSRWAWGDVRPLRLRHVLGAARGLAPVFNLGPARIGGDTNTVAQAGVRALDPLGPHGAIANHRTVVDLADPDRSRYVVAGGQSGNPLSPHYGDLFALWVRGEGVPIPWSPDAVEAAVVDVLTLTPTNPGVSDR
jgi:penicillin amidase